MEVSIEYKTQVFNALQDKRTLFTGSDESFAAQFGINKSVWSRLQKGDLDKLLSSGKWLEIGKLLNVSLHKSGWVKADTDIFRAVSNLVLLCKENTWSRFYVDEVGMGKSFAARYLANSTVNCFHLDAKQGRTMLRFVRLLANTIGSGVSGTTDEVKDRIKYWLTNIEKPVIIVDDAGYMDYKAFIELMEIREDTEQSCAWVILGDKTLQRKLERGLKNGRVGYEAFFSRFGKKYNEIVKHDKKEFYLKNIKQVIEANAPQLSASEVSQLALRCLATDLPGEYGDLRRIEPLLQLYKQQKIKIQ